MLFLWSFKDDMPLKRTKIEKGCKIKKENSISTGMKEEIFNVINFHHNFIPIDSHLCYIDYAKPFVIDKIIIHWNPY